MNILLVEGGKTKTLTLLMDDKGNILGYAIGGSSGWTTIGLKKTFENIKNTVKTVLDSSKTSISNIDYAFFGLPDLDTDNSIIKIKEALGLHLAELANVYIVPDYIIAYYAVTMGRQGISVIAGTGSIAYGKNSKGIEARAGGYGWLGNDEGSAIWIALKAIEAAFKSYDGRGTKTLLEDKVMSFFKVDEMIDIVDRMYSIAKEDMGEIAKLAKIVDETAREGDKKSKEILKLAGMELVSMAKSVYDKIKLPGEKFIVGGTGSVFSSEILSETFKKNLRKEIPDAIVVEPLISLEPIKGLLLIATEKLELKREIVRKALNYVKTLQKMYLY